MRDGGLLAERVCLVTGATSGIGRVTAAALAARGAMTVIVGRDPARTRAAVEEIRRGSADARVEGLVADLTVAAEVGRLAADFRARHGRLDVLINNAGAVFMTRQTSRDGVEMTWALNHLAPFRLTNDLLEVLRASAPSRVVNVSSSAHWIGRVRFDDLEGHRRYNGWLAYGQAKLANILFTAELARRLAGSGVTANAVHPGLVATRFGANNAGRLWSLALRASHRLALTPEQGARTTIHVAVAPEVDGVTGRYFVGSRPARSSPASRDMGVAARLWDVSTAYDAPTAAARTDPPAPEVGPTP